MKVITVNIFDRITPFGRRCSFYASQLSDRTDYNYPIRCSTFMFSLRLNGIDIRTIRKARFIRKQQEFNDIWAGLSVRRYNAHRRRARLICLIQRVERHFGGAPISPDFARPAGRPGSPVVEDHRNRSIIAPCRAEWSAIVRRLLLKEAMIASSLGRYFPRQSCIHIFVC